MTKILLIEKDHERRNKMKEKLAKQYTDAYFSNLHEEYDIIVMSYAEFHNVEIMTKRDLGWMDAHGNFQ